MATISWKGIEKDIEIAAEDLLKIVTKGASVTTAAGPGALAAFGVLAEGVEKALGDTATAAANPAQLVISLPSDIADFKTVWADAKLVLATLGVKV